MPTVVQVDAENNRVVDPKYQQREPDSPGQDHLFLAIKERNKFTSNWGSLWETAGNIFWMVEKMMTIPILELTIANTKATWDIVIKFINCRCV
jgi:hypothetical protein